MLLESWLNQGNTVWRFRKIHWNYLLQVCSWFIVKTWRSHTVFFLTSRPEFPVKMQNLFVAHTNQDSSSNKQRKVILLPIQNEDRLLTKFCENIKLPKEVGTLVINIPVVCESNSLRTEVLKNIVPSFPSCTVWLF